MFVIRVARTVVRDEVCADDGGRDDNEKSLDEENCAEPETVAGDAFGANEICAAEGEEGAEEERSQRDESGCPGVGVIWETSS